MTDYKPAPRFPQDYDHTGEKCYACDRKLGRRPRLVDTRDAQTVFVGTECFKLIEEAGEAGYQPPKGGPRLYLLPDEIPKT